MDKIHAKSACCGAQMWHHGLRRRCCSACGKSWTIRAKRRGRKARRRTGSAVLRYFKKGIRNISAYHIRRDLEYYLRNTPWHTIPTSEPLIVIADAFYGYAAGKRFTVYLTLVRSVHSHTAIIMPPTIQDGTESYQGWHDHFHAIPHGIADRIVGAVCDGRCGLLAVVREYGCIIQRCHFHLLARIQLKRSKLATSQHYDEGVRLYRLAKAMLTVSEMKACIARNALAEEAYKAPHGLRTVLSGFVAHYEDYRAYLRHPRLRLPTTTGSVESLIGSVRNLWRKLRGTRTRQAFDLWLNAYLKFRGTIQCNSQQN